MNENEQKTTSFLEAIKTGWQHPFMGQDMVYDHEMACVIAGQVRITLTGAIIGLAFAGWVFNKLADDGKLAVKDGDNGKWYLWNRLTKNWDKPIS